MRSQNERGLDFFNLINSNNDFKFKKESKWDCECKNATITETRQEKPADFGTDKKPEGGRPGGKPSGGYRDTNTFVFFGSGIFLEILKYLLIVVLGLMVLETTKEKVRDKVDLKDQRDQKVRKILLTLAYN